MSGARMGAPGGGMSAWRMARQDSGVVRHRLAPGTVRRVLAFARPYRRELTAFLLMTVLSAGIGVATPLLAGEVVNVITSGGTGRTLAVVVAIIAGLAVLDAALSLGERWYSARIGEGLIFDLRTTVFEHVQRMSLAFFTRTQTGALNSRFTSDIIGAQQAFTSTLSGVVTNVIALVLTAAVMFTLSWQITLISLLLLPVFVLPARRVGRRLQALTRERYDLSSAMSTTTVERFNVSGALLVQLFGRPEREAAAFADRAGRVRDIGVTTAMYGQVFLVALSLVAALATALTYGLGGALALGGSLEPGAVVALALLLARLYGPLTALSNVRVDIMSALVSFERVFEILDLPPLITDRPGARPLPVGGPADGAPDVEFSDVHFAYPAADEVSLDSLQGRGDGGSGPGDGVDHAPAHPVLHGVSFHARPGQLVALVGPSGAGKTTISQLVPRIYDPESGAVRIAGIDLRDATIQSVRDAVGVVAQDAHLFHDSIRNNLLYARPEATDDDLIAALRAAHIWDLVQTMPSGLDTLVGDRGHRLSGGEKQRLAIARLLLKAPSVVILDEATAHLDSESEAAVQQALAAALTGRTSLVIAHRLSTIRSADQILVVDEGRIVQRGTHDELIAQGGLYAELYRTQFEGRAPDREWTVSDSSSLGTGSRYGSFREPPAPAHHHGRNAMGIGDKISNAAENVVGKAKEAAGKATDNHDLQAEGQADQASANAKQTGEKVKDTAKDVFGR
ncbi:ATP-binding cassette domain-containing protein [Nakamurella flava]|uniref:ATP-binding cassette domain-containing protein n=1 Tax=Nakamurella flava TaxID=2576308 RepID=A0A4U6QP17_9ACTN|nr:ABC transporter transmembrane domain-containing protein [Nakamurella flava]TKV61948.1 ATP-binding cassette domain-containing protein [Nakamurella flava]